MLAQITRNNFFSMKGLRQKGGVCWHKKQEKYHKVNKDVVCASTNHNQQNSRCVSTNHKCMNRQGQQLGLGKAQITIKRGQGVLT